MTTPDSESHDITKRLEKLERDNRRMKQAGLVCLLIVASVVLMGQARPSHTLEAQEFVLRDANGKARATLSMEFVDRPTLTFRDASGFSVASLAGGDQPFLTLSRKGSEEQLQLTAAK